MLDITIIIVSNARDFLNAVCEEKIHFQGGKSTYYMENFDKFEKTKHEKNENQLKQQVGQLDKLNTFKILLTSSTPTQNGLL